MRGLCPNGLGQPFVLSYAKASAGVWQSSADDGTDLIQDIDEHANRAPHLKPKRIDEAKRFFKHCGVTKEEYDLDVSRGHRASDGRPRVLIVGAGKFSIADALDFAVGRPYVRKRQQAPYAHPPDTSERLTVRSLLGPDSDLPEGLANASHRAPGLDGNCERLARTKPAAKCDPQRRLGENHVNSRLRSFRHGHATEGVLRG